MLWKHNNSADYLSCLMFLSNPSGSKTCGWSYLKKKKLRKDIKLQENMEKGERMVNSKGGMRWLKTNKENKVRKKTKTCIPCVHQDHKYYSWYRIIQLGRGQSLWGSMFNPEELVFSSLAVILG